MRLFNLLPMCLIALVVAGCATSSSKDRILRPTIYKDLTITSDPSGATLTWTRTNGVTRREKTPYTFKVGFAEETTQGLLGPRSSGKWQVQLPENGIPLEVVANGHRKLLTTNETLPLDDVTFAIANVDLAADGYVSQT